MAESLIPEIIPGLVAVEYTGSDNKETGEKKGAVKNVFPIDAKELLMSGKYKLVDNGAVEAARLNANPLRSSQRNVDTSTVVAEVTGIGGQVHIARSAEDAEKLIAAADHGGKPAPADPVLSAGTPLATAAAGNAREPAAPTSSVAAVAVPVETAPAGKPTGAKADSDKK